MAVKFVYSDSEVKEIVEKYGAGIDLETLAADYNKSVPSVRMKLVKLGVYQKATKTVAVKTSVVKKPAAPTTKTGILQAFNDAMNLAGPALL